MTYAKNNADIETMASLEVGSYKSKFLILNATMPLFFKGVMGALYFGIGKAAGSLIGGLVIEDIGVNIITQRIKKVILEHFQDSSQWTL